MENKEFEIKIDKNFIGDCPFIFSPRGLRCLYKMMKKDIKSILKW